MVNYFNEVRNKNIVIKFFLVLSTLFITSTSFHSFAQISETKVVDNSSLNFVSREKIELLSNIACNNFSDLAKAYQQKFVNKMSEWSRVNLSKANYQTAFYPFSGPDVVTVMSIYPKANYYVLVADQAPEYEYIKHPEKMSGKSQAFECQMISNFSQRGYYLTNDLNGKNGPTPRFIKLLIYNIAFSGSKILEMNLLKVDVKGLIVPAEPQDDPNGVRFILENKEGNRITLDYLKADLSNQGLDKHKDFLRACERKSSQVVLLKSASHLLQNDYFSIMKDTLVKNAKWITQDETGLDIIPLAETFNLELYGKFISPNGLWAKSPSAQRLAEYYSRHPSKEDLPFLLGYEKKGGSMLMVGERK